MLQPAIIKPGDVVFVSTSAGSKLATAFGGFESVLRVSTDILNLISAAAARPAEQQQQQMNAQTLDVRETMRILWRRRMLLIIPWAIATLAGMAGAFLLSRSTSAR